MRTDTIRSTSLRLSASGNVPITAPPTQVADYIIIRLLQHGLLDGNINQQTNDDIRRELQSMPRVLNKRHIAGPVPNSVYIGRPGIHGNPFRIGPHGSRRHVVEKYIDSLPSDRDALARIRCLRGKHLVCWCHPLDCHGHVNLLLANSVRFRCPN
jgi:hypothetical protein